MRFQETMEADNNLMSDNDSDSLVQIENKNTTSFVLNSTAIPDELQSQLSAAVPSSSAQPSASSIAASSALNWDTLSDASASASAASTFGLLAKDAFASLTAYALMDASIAQPNASAPSVTAAAAPLGVVSSSSLLTGLEGHLTSLSAPPLPPPLPLPVPPPGPPPVPLSTAHTNNPKSPVSITEIFALSKAFNYEETVLHYKFYARVL